MIQRTGFNAFGVPLAAAAVAASLNFLAGVAGAAPETFESLAQKADSIVVGKCVAKQCVVRSGMFVTTHEIQVKENLKGKSVTAGQNITVASLGGSFKAPPVSQYVNDQPEIVEGEDVLLFLQPPAAQSTKRSVAAQVPELASSARVVGGARGKFSIITDPADKQLKVVHVRCEDYGVMPDDRLLRTILGAIEKGQIETTDSSSLVDLGGGVQGPESAREALDNAVRITDSLRKATPKDSELTVQAKAVPVPAPTLDEVKARIARITKKQ